MSCFKEGRNRCYLNLWIIIFTLRYCGQDSRIALPFTNICPFSFFVKNQVIFMYQTLVNILFIVLQNLGTTKKSVYGLTFTCSEVAIRKLQMMEWNVKPAKLWFLLSFKKTIFLNAIIECLEDLQFLVVIGFPILLFCLERGVFDPFIHEWIWMLTADAFLSTIVQTGLGS